MFRVYVTVHQCDFHFAVFYDFRTRSDAIAFYNAVNKCVCAFMRCSFKEVREDGEE